MSAEHVVRQGECVATVARRCGFESPRALWDHPDNAGLRARRDDPDVLCPGDRVRVPAREERVERVTTGAAHTFRLVLPRKELRVALRDAHGDPVARAPYALTVGATRREGVTDGDGRVREPVPPGALEALLEVEGASLRLRLGHLTPVRDTPDRGVSGAQMRLRNLGYPTGPVDGVLGPRTRAALRLFQRDEALADSGALDAETAAALVRAHGC